MGRIRLAFGLFFKVLGNAEFAEFVGKIAERESKRRDRPKLAEPKPAAAAPAAAKEPRPEPAPPKPARSEALTLLAALQREGRLVDFLKEDLSGFDDAQVGAAARDVHRNCQSTIERMLAIRPLRSEPEGASVEVPVGFDSQAVRLVGRVEGEPPFRGSLTHHGWAATKIELPTWSGGPDSALILSPAEVELG